MTCGATQIDANCIRFCTYIHTLRPDNGCGYPSAATDAFARSCRPQKSIRPKFRCGDLTIRHSLGASLGVTPLSQRFDDSDLSSLYALPCSLSSVFWKEIHGGVCGGSAAKRMRSPLCGCRNSSANDHRAISCARSGCAPYFLSPISGKPWAENWARIWCVRPVSRVMCTSDSPFAVSSVR